MAIEAQSRKSERATAVHSYDIMRSEPEPAYDELARLAARICECPAAGINIIDDAYMWPKSRLGLPPLHLPLPREFSICATAIAEVSGPEMIVVPDLSKDARFANLPSVAGEPHLRFYCGMPLINPEGHVLGTLCVLDFHPRDISFEQREAVRQLSRQVMSQMELRRSLLMLTEARRQIATEREKSERLLNNMLPAAIAEQLKDGGRVAPRYYDTATILFADFEGFTKLTERMEPKLLIEQLDTYFSAVDRIAEQRKLEMLKTIGDAYMCVGGLPEINRSHCVDACMAAIDMLRFTAEINREREALRLPRWELRIGIHTGPVIAGVVGRRKLLFDVWGNAVNVAARMETAGTAGKINVSQAVRDHAGTFFDFEERGFVEIKHGSTLPMFFLTRIKPQFALDESGFVPNPAFAAAYEAQFAAKLSAT